MPRHSDSTVKPGAKKPGAKPGKSKVSKLKPEQIIEKKVEILDLLSNGQAGTLTEAAKIIGVRPVQVYHWNQTDKDFQEMVKLVREVKADEIETYLRGNKNLVAQIFLLKGYRPMFRDSYRVVEIRDEKTKELLEELRKLGKQENKVEETK